MNSKDSCITNKVSVIIPVYGAEQYLNDCIDSVLSQRDIDLEIVCIHDESPDNSLWILETYRSEYPGIIKIIDQKNTGGATAINNGLDASSGEFVMVLDCDDFIIGNGLQYLYDRIRKDNSDFVISKIQKYSNEKYSTAYDRAWINSDYVITNEVQKQKLFQNGMYTGLLFRSEFLNKHRIRMKDGLRVADRPFTALAYAFAKRISVANYVTCAWRKRNSAESISLTDRVYDRQEIHDRIEMANCIHDSLVANNFPQYKNYYDKDIPKRIIWQLRRGWATWRFDVGYHNYFFSESKSYFLKLDEDLFKHHPIYIRLLSNALYRSRRVSFLALSAAFFLASMGSDIKTGFARSIRHTLKALSNRVPISIFRLAHRWFPQYQHHKSYRRFLNTTKVDDATIIFESNFGKSFSGNPKYIYKYILENFPEFNCIWVNQGRRLEIDGNPNQIKRGTNEYYYYLAISRFWVNNIRFPVEEKRKSTVYLQTWHGTPLKALGFDIPYQGPEVAARESLFRESRNWSYLLCQNEYSAAHFKSAFQYNGNIINFGYPCNDIFYSKDKSEISKRVRDKLNIPHESKVVLYAPTWRDQSQISKWVFKSQSAIDYSNWAANTSSDTVLLVREHHLVQPGIVDDSLSGRIIDVSRYDDVSELLLISDCLVTDYSSVFFDYLNLQRPIVFFMHDKESYQSSMRPFYIDIETELPGPIVTDQDSLHQCINKSDEVLRSYSSRLSEAKKMYCANDDGNAASRVVNYIFK
ncbi:MAG: hypothetical protein A2Z95_00745 [Gallionellales bacterium GWA2_60_18]|nr:MAG: hypothetical protein A2Z95_00745 [Gallionellales bacterium GWA2_60_18]